MDTMTYRARRAALRELGTGRALFLGLDEAPRNYRANPYPFRQDSHFLYFTGISQPDLALVIDLASGEEVLYGPPSDLDDVVWHGPKPTLAETAAAAGIAEVRDLDQLASDLKQGKGSIRYLPPYRESSRARHMELTNSLAGVIASNSCRELAHAVAELRLVKSDAEIAEIENALAVTAEMHRASMRATRPGVMESAVAAATQAVALAADRQQAYNPIISVRGEVLHNHEHGNRLEAGQLLLNDSGAESPMFYASDITRTVPVTGRFDPRQREIYEIVLAAQLGAIAATGPGRPYLEVHLESCRIITNGLIQAGIMKGNADAAVEAGAHALFFPHGLGHMLGLDVHDMEDLGEDIVGYLPNQARSTQFGLSFLRCARPLAEGHVVTSEPGIYFIPALIDRWSQDGQHRDFINYDRLDAYRDFGGIRIEDDVLCTASGRRVLGPGIEKTVAEIEALMAR
ncbi:MAG: aminopeptidase P family protein [Planctomycetes bacterium]|nr:aminopeptidase P family protein [Planctomycetota bacterium]